MQLDGSLTASEGDELIRQIFLLSAVQLYNVVVYYLHSAMWRENQWTLAGTGY